MQSTTAEPKKKKSTIHSTVYIGIGKEESKKYEWNAQEPAKKNTNTTLATIFVQFTVKVFEREWKIAYNDNRCTKLSMKAKNTQTAMWTIYTIQL